MASVGVAGSKPAMGTNNDDSSDDDREDIGEQKSRVIRNPNAAPVPAQFRIASRVRMMFERDGRRRWATFIVRDRRMQENGLWEYMLKDERNQAYVEKLRGTQVREWFPEDKLEFCDD